MNFFPEILPAMAAFVALYAMVVSDMRRRVVDWRVLVIFGLSITGHFAMRFGVRETVFNALCNLTVVGVMSAVVWGYLSLRHKHVVNPLRRHFGVGDLLFVVCLTPVVNVMLFVVILICSMIAGLIYHCVSRRDTIPFVSMAGVVSFLSLTARELFMQLDL